MRWASNRVIALFTSVSAAMATPGPTPVSAEIKVQVHQDEAVEALAKAHVSIKACSLEPVPA